MNPDRYTYRIAAIIGLLFGCGGGGEPAAAPVGGETGARPEAAALTVSEPTGEIDEELAERGEDLFETKGCIACHTIGKGRLTGPDLAGVTERRSFTWTYDQIMRPDSMTLHDPTARQLMAEYMTQMPNLMLQPEEVKALYEHLREEDQELAENRGEGGGQ